MGPVGGLANSDRWDVLTPDEDAERRLVRECGVSPLVARVLSARGMVEPERVRHFLTPSLERDWCDPLLIPGMDEAAARVLEAIRAGERIAIFGDFDVDGMSSTCLLALGLTRLGARGVRSYIPHRFDEGYGLSRDALGRVMADGKPDLVITVDNGIAARDEVAWLLSEGVDVVVTDHHEPADLVPTGVPVCDPKLQADCPSRELAGAGVALKLVCELGRRLGQPDVWLDYVEVATLGTISDMMLLTGENRALVAAGIERLRHTGRAGIVALAAAAGVDLASVTSDSLPFSLVPRLNAAGRMGCVEVALDLLLCDDPERAATLAARLESVNHERREIESALAEEAFAKAEATYKPGDRLIVVAGEGWHEGVKGIVAGRLSSRYHVPSILFTVSDGVAIGSGRSVGSVDLFHAVEQCADLCVRFGGHAAAIGVTVDVANLEAFRERLSQVLAGLPDDQFVSTDEVAAVVGLGELNVETIGSLEVMQPFGQGNKKPLFAATGVCMRGRARAGANGDHLRFAASDGIHSIPAIMFRTPDIEYAYGCDAAVDLVFEPVVDTWQGRTKAKLMVRDILYRTPAEGQAPVGTVADELEARAAEALDPHASAALSAPVSDAVAPELAERERLALLGADELTNELRRRMIGDSELLDAQATVLHRLAQGRSAMLVMATGRGKSLVFHLHAAREAIAHGSASVFVFPLRALVADQAYHLARSLAPMGVSVRVLTGETPLERRGEIFSELASGACDVILTTPEFLSIHVGRFAATGRVRFLVVDESHHVAGATGDGRAAYADLGRVAHELGDPCALALTATATDETARQVSSLLGIAAADVVVDRSVRSNLLLEDARELRDRECALVSVVASGEKTICYVNSREQSVAIARMLRRAVPDLAPRISYYNAGLSREDRGRVERAFRDGELTCIVSTSAFGEGVNLPDVRHVVLYHMPFGSTEFNQMSGRAGRDGRPATVHLLFGSRDARLNERLLASSAPDRDQLVLLYRVLGALGRRANEGVGRPTFSVANADIAASAREVDTRSTLDERAVSCGIGVFRELGFLNTEGFGTQRTITMVESPRRMRLEDSIRYLEGVRSREAFSRFRDWVLTASSDDLLARINRPIAPGFGTVVGKGE